MDLRSSSDHVTFAQQVIVNLSNQVTSWMVDQQLAAPNHSSQQTFKQLQQQVENLQVSLLSAQVFGPVDFVTRHISIWILRMMSRHIRPRTSF